MLAKRRLEPSFCFVNPILEREVFSRIAIVTQMMNMLMYHPSLRIDVLTPNRKNGMPIGANESGGRKIEKSILLFRRLSVGINIFSFFASL